MNRALDFCQKSVKIDSYYAEVFELIGLINVRLNQVDNARKNFARAFMINPNLVEPINDLTRLNIQAGQPGETLKVLEVALNKYDDNLVLLEQVARRYIDMGRYQAAQDIGSKMLVIDPKAAQGYVIRGLAELRLKKLVQANEDLQQALMIDPKNISSYSALGEYYLATGDHARAREAYLQVLQLDPNNSVAKAMLGRLGK